jgi:hypothetical protein
MCYVAIPYIIAAVTAVGTAAYSANQQKIATERQMRVQQQQTDAGAQAQTDDRMKAAREQRASARAASAESGASGYSSDAILNDIMMQSGRDVSRIEKNRENGQLESQQQLRSRMGEINGQLTSSIASTATSLGYAEAAGYSDRIPKIPNAGQHAAPTISLDRQQYAIGK